MSRHPAFHVVSRLGLTVVLAFFLTVVNSSLPARGSAATTPLKSTDIAVVDQPGDVATVITSDGLSYAQLPEFDILSGDITQDRPDSQVRVSLQMAGPSTGTDATLRVALGYTKSSGVCSVFDDYSGTADSAPTPTARAVYILQGTLHMRAALGPTPINGPFGTTTPVSADYVIGSSSVIGGSVALARDGNTITLTTDPSPYFAARGWDCAHVDVERVNAKGVRTEIDGVDAFAPDDPTPAPIAAPTPIGNATAQVIDADGDGVPDVTDVCPQVPGAGTNGCLSTPIARSVVLGTKRVIFDRLILRTGAKCPAAAKVTAVLKGKTVGSGQIGVLQHSRWCQVQGVLKLKKKVAKTRVTVKGTGMAPFAITVVK